MKPLPPHVLEELQAADWKELGKHLVAYTNWLVNANLVRETMLPGGQVAQDFVTDAIRKVFSGIRMWNPQKVDLLTFMKGVICGR